MQGREPQVLTGMEGTHWIPTPKSGKEEQSASPLLEGESIHRAQWQHLLTPGI